MRHVIQLARGLSLSVPLALATSIAAAEGVPPGADMATYQAAFKDMEPIVLQTQTAGGPGGVTGIYVEHYAKALEEWSGGKLKMDIAYGSAIQRGENSPALADGRLFFATVLPMYKPSDYPKNAAYAGMLYDPGHSPLFSVLQANAAAADAAGQISELFSEYADAGVMMTVGAYSGLPMALFCSKQRDGLDAMRGAVVRTSGAQHATQVEGLGMSSASMPWGEIFEALQRGAVDCALTHSMVYVLGGLEKVAPYWSYPEQGSFASGASAPAFDKEGFDALPLVARQLLIDRMDVYFGEHMRAYVRESLRAFKAMNSVNGKRTAFDAGADTRLQEVTARIQDDIVKNGPFDDNAAVVRIIKDSQEKWARILTELGYADMDKGWDGVESWLDPETLDLAPFMARFAQEVLLPLRPVQ